MMYKCKSEKYNFFVYPTQIFCFKKMKDAGAASLAVPRIGMYLKPD